jgi:hypothetical protein
MAVSERRFSESSKSQLNGIKEKRGSMKANTTKKALVAKNRALGFPGAASHPLLSYELVLTNLAELRLRLFWIEV